MGIPNTTHQVASNAIAAEGNWISLHQGAGAGTTGANEASGGGYNRVQTTWAPDGVGDNNGSQVNIPCAAGTYTEGGIFSTQILTLLPAPSGLTISAASGGSLVSGTTYYVTVTAVNFAGETTVSNEQSITPSGSNLSASIHWSAVTGAASYNVYLGTSAGGENVRIANVTGTSYTISATTGTSATPPNSNTASTFVGSAAFTGGSVTVTGTGASINVTPSITA
ncbi:hypothetical protein [Mycobacterium colombiense]|uniref:hypothetical protein n=1 Tax=Mycobacterium colombiense TaxID=339268 RepID=UPI00105762C0|nr:hypothetical protein [Mycobacterium colombiense]